MEIKKPRGYRFVDKIKDTYIFCKPKMSGFSWKVVGALNTEGLRAKYDIMSEDSYETTLNAIKLNAEKGRY
jgi:hypothetical protein